MNNQEAMQKLGDSVLADFSTEVVAAFKARHVESVVNELLQSFADEKRKMLETMLENGTIDRELYNYYYNKFKCNEI